jgi:hypothetical protein
MKYTDLIIKYIPILFMSVLFIMIIEWTKYNIKKQYLLEHFYNRQSTINQVDMPIVTRVNECNNECSPQNRCIITGEQCLSDLDCGGCVLHSETIMEHLPLYSQNISGKIEDSKLLLDIASNGSELEQKQPVQYEKGMNTWQNQFNEGKKMYDKRYYPSGFQFTPSYPREKSMTGDFVVTTPPAANTTIYNDTN